MTERLADISARIDGIRQLGAVVNAMRGIAAARAQQARGQLVAVDSYAATIAAAIGRALALLPPVRPDGRASIGRAGAGAVLRRTGIRRRLQRARARRGRRRSRRRRTVPDRHARRRRRRGKGRRRPTGKAPCRRIRRAFPSSPTASPRRCTRRIAAGAIDRLDAVFTIGAGRRRAGRAPASVSPRPGAPFRARRTPIRRC